MTRRAVFTAAAGIAMSAVTGARATASPGAFGTDLPGIVQTVPTGGRPTLALTFDACGGPRGNDVDVELLDVLLRYQVPATLFLNRRWIAANLELAHTLAADPLFALGNHGTRHVPLSVSGRSAYGIAGTRSPSDAAREVADNQAFMTTEFGRSPGWFRTGTAHYDGPAVAIVGGMGLWIAGYAVNGDAGATLEPRQVAQQLLTAPSGAIVLCHMNKPDGGTAEGFRAALPILVRSGTEFVHLSR
ncbi:Peptidoglycan/xylan/chitin deacetylase, PgdA/CDA1 family [Williamsia serinedens]|uniref:Peptidoglycan/xylan/chitin deacetylase, PgdA/CDA1 family n=2 Tax=Williamsia serinedens TaxID=391736 RepID=A0ABT1H1P8_9NOCA|nr:Peptidoglycan/xylan/chitin deacetylase, PgdA/CDA1 family [Williamsia serinedens]